MNMMLFVNAFIKLLFLLSALWLSMYFYGKIQIRQIGSIKLLSFGFSCVFLGLVLNFLFSEQRLWSMGFWSSGFIEDDLIVFSIGFGLGVFAKVVLFYLKKR
ncbi:hypothetical protein [Paenacidovorax monticola]|uniref:Uncharacterized protein n=1 Tax=Paenacidovorax monticola TaxID=1926868 RepID=A0A7H0HHB0_9BURK|nr:hypothetical protein [Paenacidovorax monticola]QNP59926.1 hypothetical protein H9L24_02870 [Paenacidovorax monticola]